jgi:hypothetical protein
MGCIDEKRMSGVFNHQIFQQRAFGLKYREMAPEIKPLKLRAFFGLGH